MYLAVDPFIPSRSAQDPRRFPDVDRVDVRAAIAVAADICLGRIFAEQPGTVTGSSQA
jgi:hypothetical protein